MGANQRDKSTTPNDPVASVALRLGLALFLTLAILLVVLLSCLAGKYTVAWLLIIDCRAFGTVLGNTY
jgi:hypothetical protein